MPPTSTKSARGRRETASLQTVRLVALLAIACFVATATSARAQEPSPEAPADGSGQAEEAPEAEGTEETPADDEEPEDAGATVDDEEDEAAGDGAPTGEDDSAEEAEEDYSAYDDDEEDYSAYDDDEEDYSAYDDDGADEAAAGAAAPPPVDGSRVPAGAIVLGAGVGIALIGALTGAYVLNTESRLASECPGDVCPHELESTRDAGKTLAIVTDVLLITGGVVAATGIALWAIFGAGDAEPADDTGADFSAACGPSGCAATVSGRF